MRLDHINIRTARLAESIAFYRDILGFRIAPPPMQTDLSKGAYACDESGNALVHLVGADRVIDGEAPVRGAAQRGMIDHFAFRGADRAELIARLDTAGITAECRDVPAIGMQLFFMRDPNDILVEVGFPLEDAA